MTVGLLVGVVVLGLIIYFVIMPSWSQITETKAMIEVDTAQLARLKTKHANLEEAESNYQQIASEINIIDEAVPNYSNVPQVMTILEKLASEVLQEGGPLLIDTMRISTMPNDTPTSAQDQTDALSREEATVLVSLTGDYQAIKDYVIKIRSLRHNFYVEKIILSANQDQNNQFLDASITLKYYYFE